MPWAPDYATVADLAAYVGIDDAADDVELAYAISAASRAIDDVCNRQFGVVDVAEARTYTARPDYRGGYRVVDVDDYMTAPTVVEVDGNTVATYDKAPLNAAAKGRPWTRVVFTADSEYLPTTHPNQVAVTALWGWTEVPAAVTAACLLQAARFFKRRVAPFGVAGSPDQGSEVRLLARVDPDVAVTLRGYKRPRVVG